MLFLLASFKIIHVMIILKQIKDIFGLNHFTALLTLNCRASARPHGTSLALPVMCWALNLQSQHTRKQAEWVNIY